MMNVKPIKVVVVGDAESGKNSLLLTFSTKSARTDDWTPGAMRDVLGEFPACVKVDGKPQDLLVHGMSGQEECDRLRPLTYTDAEVFMICYSVDNRESFRNARFKWFPEIKKYSPDTPVLMVACKSDLRQKYLDGDERIVMTAEGESIAKSLMSSKEFKNCYVGYCETSADKLEGVDACFTMAANLSKAKVKKKKYFFK